MAKYNTFVVCDCKKRVTELVTSSARKANEWLIKGKRIEVWNENQKIDVLYAHKRNSMKVYITAEKEYIGQKQRKAELRNFTRSMKRI